MRIEMTFGDETASLEFNGTQGLKSALGAIYAQRAAITGVSIYEDGKWAQPLPGRLVYKRINLRPSPMAKVAFESQDFTLGIIMNLAGSVMMYPDLEVRELNGNLFIRIEDELWAIIGEQTVFYAEQEGEREYRL